MQSGLEAGSMQVGEAQRTLIEVERVRRDTRRDLHPMAYSNIVVGLFFAGATLVGLLATSGTLPTVYWVLGLPAALALIVRYEMQREREIGAEAPLADPALLVIGLIVAGVLAVNGLVDSGVAWAFPVAAGWLAIGALYRDVLIAGAAVALAAIAIAMIAVDPPDAWAWTQGAMAGLLIAAGIVGRSWERP